MQKKLLLFLLVLSFTGFLSCENTGTDESSVSGNISVQNSFGSQITYELWKGEDMRYDEGAIKGKTVEILLASKTLADSSTDSSISSISEETQILFVFGASGYYVNHTVFTAKSSVTITVNANGTISVN